MLGGFVFFGGYMLLALLQLPRSHTVNLRLTFYEPARLFSKMLIPYYIPTSEVRGFCFFHILNHRPYLRNNLNL